MDGQQSPKLPQCRFDSCCLCHSTSPHSSAWNERTPDKREGTGSNPVGETTWGCSSVGMSVCMACRRSPVRSRSAPPKPEMRVQLPPAWATRKSPKWSTNWIGHWRVTTWVRAGYGAADGARTLGRRFDAVLIHHMEGSAELASQTGSKPVARVPPWVSGSTPLPSAISPSHWRARGF